MFTHVYFILKPGKGILHLQLNRLILFIYHEPNADFVGEFSCYPFMTGARCVATLLNEMKRHGKDCRYGVISMCIGR